MLRSLRTPIFASLVALAFAACGGGSSNPPPNPDGGTGDGPKVQFDGPRPDGAAGQQDGGGGQLDGGGGAECVTTGGKPESGLCKANGDCTCPNGCAKIFSDVTVAGSCWKACTGAAGECTAPAECVGFTTTEGYCLPKGTVSGTFTDIPMYDAAATVDTLGTVAMTLAVADINVTFAAGYGKKSSDGAWYFVFMYPGTTSAPDQSKALLLACKSATYSAKTYDLSAADGCDLMYSELTVSGTTLTAWTDKAFIFGGTLTLTAAGTGAKAPVTGSVTAGEAYKLIQEECGPNSGPC